MVNRTNATRYSTWMLESVIGRKEGVVAADGLLSGIQKGFFQEAVRAAIARSHDRDQTGRWLQYLNDSVQYNVEEFTDATTDSLAPLDRLCAGVSFMLNEVSTQSDKTALKALRESLDLQLTNWNGGYWYFVDPPPPYINYSNLSYSDGMYGVAPFDVLYGLRYGDADINIDAAFHQLDALWQQSFHPETGLIVHGYDGSKKAPWADPVTGASPEVWGRSMAWYTIGLLNALEIADTSDELRRTPSYRKMREMFYKLGHGEIAAIQNSANQTGRYGVWQVADKPGKEKNFVEASATTMLVYALAKGLRRGYFDESDPADCHKRTDRATQAYNVSQQDVQALLKATYEDVLDHFVVQNDNGTLDFEGTVVICSLHETDPYFDYYVNRPVSTNSLIGTSAFVLASLEMERIQDPSE